MFKPHFTTTLVVTSREINAFYVFASQASLRATSVISVGPCPRDQLNAKDADMEKVLRSPTVTTGTTECW